MTRRAIIVGVVVCCVAAAAALAIWRSDADRGPAAADDCRRYCIAVEPREGDTETIFAFRGRGWRPRQPITALFGPYCDRRDCEDEGRAVRFRADDRGEFVFRFRRGPDPLPPGTPSPSAQGGGPLQFEAWTGRAFQSRRILRRPDFEVDGSAD